MSDQEVGIQIKFVGQEDARAVIAALNKAVNDLKQNTGSIPIVLSHDNGTAGSVGAGAGNASSAQTIYRTTSSGPTRRGRVSTNLGTMPEITHQASGAAAQGVASSVDVRPSGTGPINETAATPMTAGRIPVSSAAASIDATLHSYFGGSGGGSGGSGGSGGAGGAGGAGGGDGGSGGGGGDDQEPSEQKLVGRPGTWSSLHHNRNWRRLQAKGVDVDESMSTKQVYAAETEHIVSEAGTRKAIGINTASEHASRVFIKSSQHVDPSDPVALAAAEQRMHTENAILRHDRNWRRLQVKGVNVDESMGTNQAYAAETEHIVSAANTRKAISINAANERASRVFVKSSRYVNPSDPVALAAAEQRIHTENTMQTRMRSEYRHQARVDKANAGYSQQIPENATEEQLLNAEKFNRDEKQNISNIQRRARGLEKRNIWASDIEDWNDARLNGSDQDFDSFTNSPGRRFGRMLKTPGGKYARSFARGALYATGQTAAEYFHLKAEEDLTGRRNDLVGAQVVGSVIGGLLGASVGAAFGGIGSIVGASTGSAIGQQFATLALGPGIGIAHRAIENRGLITGSGYNAEAMEAENRRLASQSWKPDFGKQQGLHNVINSLPGGVGDFMKRMDDLVSRAINPDAVHATDVLDINTMRQQITSLSLAGGKNISPDEMSGLLASHNTRDSQVDLLNLFKRVAIAPQSGYNKASEFLAMGPEAYFNSFNGYTLPKEMRDSYAKSYRNVQQSDYNTRVNEAGIGGGDVGIQNQLLSGRSMSTQQGAIDSQSKRIQIQRNNLEFKLAAILTLDGGAGTPDYEETLAAIGQTDSKMLGLARTSAMGLRREQEARVGGIYASSARSMQNIELRGGSYIGQTGRILGAMDSDIAAQEDNLRRMRKGGFTAAEIASQENSIYEAQTKRQRVPFEMADKDLGRYETQRGVTMGRVSNQMFQATQYGTMGDITSAYNKGQEERQSTRADLLRRRPNVSYDQQLAIDNQITGLDRQDMEDKIGLRDIDIQRGEDRYGLTLGTEQRALQRMARKGGISGYRAAAGVIAGTLQDENLDLGKQLARGGLTYDQELRIKHKQQQIGTEIENTEWDSLETGINMRYRTAGNQVRGSGRAMLSAVTMAGQEYSKAGVQEDSPIWGDLNTKRRGAQAMAYAQQDILQYGIPMAGLNAAENIAQSMPFSPGSGMQRASQRMGLRGRYLKERIGRYHQQMQAGDLSEEEQMSSVNAIYGLEEQQAHDLGSFARGGVNRIVGASAGMPSFRGRYDSMALARTALWKSGNPRLDMGFASGGHMQQSHNWFDQFAGPGFDPSASMNAVSRNSGVTAAVSGHGEMGKMVQLLGALVDIVKQQNGSGIGGNPGSGPLVQEQRQRLDAGLQQGRLNPRSGYGVRG